MSAWLEVRSPGGTRRVSLESGRLTLGSDEADDVSLAADPALAPTHVAFERISSGWCVRHLGDEASVNGAPISGERRLHSGDVIEAGATLIVFRSDEAEPTATEGAEPPPELTRAEREVLVELCRPLLMGTVFTEPASIHDIAEALVVTDSAVKKHLVRLYRKFRITGEGERRRVRLANDAVLRGAVNLADLRSAPRRGVPERE